MTLTFTASEFGAIHIQEEHRNRKSPFTKPDEAKSRTSNFHVPNDFPYRYVFPANHPYSSFMQYLSPPPAATPYHNQNSQYDPFSTLNSHQQYSSGHAEYKYVAKPETSYQVNNPPFTPSSSVTQLPFHSPSAPIILLVHPSHSTTGTGGAFQTFMLIPADSSKPVSSLGFASQPYTGGNIPSLQLPSVPSYNVGLAPAPQHVLPITPASVQQPLTFRQPPFTKPVNSHFHGLLQRPINVYSMSNGKYYPQKKSSFEPRMSSPVNKSIGYMSTSTEGN